MKKISLEQLKQQGIVVNSCYLLHGQDPLLIDEVKHCVNNMARAEGFSELLLFNIDANSDWQTIYQVFHTKTLFIDKQVIMFTLPDNLNQSIQKHLFTVLQLWHSDIVLIFQLSKLNVGVERQDWYQLLKSSVTQQGYIIDCQTPTLAQLPRWVRNRLTDLKLDADEEAIQLLCYSYESNLLALKQQIDLLNLTYTDGKLTYQRVKQCVEQMSLFTPYQWIDAIFEGKSKRALRILQSLKNEEIQPLILLRNLQKELMTVIKLVDALPVSYSQANLPTEQLRQQFDQMKIWQVKRQVYSQLIQRLTYHRLYQALQQLATIEKQLKQAFNSNVWGNLTLLTQQLSH